MATRTTRPPADVEDWPAAPAGAPPADDAQAEQSPIERVMIALSETADPGARARLMLYRVVPGALGKPERVEYCEDMMPSEFEAQGLGGIRDVWGPGTYEARLMGHKVGSPHFVRLAAPRFTLAPLPSGAMQRGDSAGASIEAALRALADSQSRMFEALIEQRSAPAPAVAPVNPVAQLKEILELQSLMRDASGSGSAAPQQKSTIGEILDAIKELKEVSSIVNPGGAPERTAMEQLLELAGPLVGMVQQALQNRPQSSAPTHQVFEAPQLRVPKQFSGENNAGLAHAPVRPVPGRAVETSVPAQGGEDSVSSLAPPHDSQTESQAQEIILNELQGHLKELVSMAEKGEPVEKGAELVYDKLPDDWIELLHMEIWWSALSTAAPAVVEHAVWFKLVRDRVVQMFKQDAEDDAAGVRDK